MRTCSRRSILSALGIVLPFGAGAVARESSGPMPEVPSLRFRPFEESLRAALADLGEGRKTDPHPPRRRVEVGPSDLVLAGLQGCHNDRLFAGYPAGCLRIVRSGSEPGPIWRGTRLYVSTVDVVLSDRPDASPLTRPLDFATLPPAPVFT